MTADSVLEPKSPSTVSPYPNLFNFSCNSFTACPFEPLRSRVEVDVVDEPVDVLELFEVDNVGVLVFMTIE